MPDMKMRNGTVQAVREGGGEAGRLEGGGGSDQLCMAAAAVLV